MNRTDAYAMLGLLLGLLAVVLFAAALSGPAQPDVTYPPLDRVEKMTFVVGDHGQLCAYHGELDARAVKGLARCVSR